MPKSTLILVNTLQAVNNFAYSNHINFIIELHKQFPDDKFHLYTPHRMSIDNARNSAAKYAMQLECDYLLFLDDDVLVPMDAYKKLRDADKDVVAGITYVRAFPFPQMAYREVIKDDKPHLDMVELDVTAGNLEKVDALGFSLCLIKVEILKSTEEPWFVTIYDKCTEDVYFCCKIRDARPETSIFIHAGVHTSHILTPEVVHASNIKELRAFYSQGRPLPEAMQVKSV